jgi:H+-translocating NAD(P) transhydrogenase subunit alpha
MRVAIPRELRAGERRVAATPETTARLVKLGFEVIVESGAGEAASFRNADYEASGARIVTDSSELWRSADVVIKVQPPEELAAGDPRRPGLIHEADLLREGGTIISFLWPAKNSALVERLAARKLTAIAMDQIPRVTRAQKMDALSSMANIAGYRAVIEAASFFGRFFTGQMTAAGKVPPARILVIGAGVAGLAAIGAARGLGAIVRAFDTRPTVKEQIVSMGAEFLQVELEEEGTGEGGYARVMSPAFIEAEKNLFRAQATEVDIIITTALIPGKPAPVLLDEALVESMRPGSVIVDLAAEFGGNCALTRPGEVITHRGVTIIGFVDLPSRLAPTASQLYGSNLVHLLADMGGAKSWHIDLDNEVVRGALILLDGKSMWPPPPKIIEAPPPTSRRPALPPPVVAAAAKVEPKPEEAAHHATAKGGPSPLFVLAVAAVLAIAGFFVPGGLVGHLTVFVLACFVGWQVVWNVTPALHTPLMSVTNAISGIILVGGMLQLTGSPSSPSVLLGAIAVLLATINVAGGFLVTERMLRMFRR